MARKRTDREGHYFTEERRLKGRTQTYYCWKIVVGGRGADPIVVKRTTAAERKTVVQEKLAELEATGHLGKPSKDQTVKERLIAWLEYRVKPHREYKTYVSYKGAIEGYVIPAIGRMKASKVGYLDLQKVADRARKEGYDRMASYAPRVACTGLGLSIKTMKADGLIVPAEKVRDRVGSMEELEEIFTELYRKRELKTQKGTEVEEYRDRHLLAFVMNTGLRISEALGILTVRLNLREAYLEVQEQLKREKDEDDNPTWRLGETKSKQTRRIPMNADTVLVVREQLRMLEEDKRLAGRGYVDNGLLFATESGKPGSTSNVLRSLTRAIKAINERREAENASLAPDEHTDPMEHMTVHDLRTSYITHLAGVEDKIQFVSRIAGHSNIGTTLKHYVFAQEKGLRAATDKITLGKRKIGPS